MTNYLFLFTIGPVQSFISQARKTQDLYSGSQILSDLISEAMEMDRLPNGSEIIFPKGGDSNPNRFIAIINDSDPEQLGQKIKEAVRDKFRSYANDALAKVGCSAPSNFQNQVENFLQIYWAALPCKDYIHDYQKIESLLGAIKNVRPFLQMDEDRRKCSLCGERNALFCRAQTSPLYIQIDACKRNDLRILKGEGLCAICFTKRFYKTGTFPSTAKIALMETLHRLKEQPEIYVFLDKYQKCFEDNMFDEQLYYGENLTKPYFEKHDLDDNITELSEIVGKQKQISEFEFAKKEKLELSKYYAIIAFDGDNMGKWLSGSKISMEFHKDLSKNLGDFAKEAKRYLDDNQRGRTVYAGGDDFLGFVNLNHLFAVMKKLREEFDARVNEKLKGYFADEDNKITFSAGIAIAHYKTPLSEVLNRARRMEREAKDFDDEKDAFGIAVLKRSGEIHETVYKWQYDGSWPIDLIKDISGRLKNDELSNTFIKSLNIEFLKLMDEKGRLYEDEFDYGNMLSTEINRLLERSRKPTEKGDKIKEKIKELAEQLEKLYSAERKRNNSFENFLSLLNIADFISRHINKGGTE